MDAELLIRRRVVVGPEDVAELVAWRVPTPVPPSAHGFEYRLVHIVDGARMIGLDTERGKGGHRHDDGVESPYAFSDVDRLLTDVVEAVGLWRLKHGRDRDPGRPRPA